MVPTTRDRNRHRLDSGLEFLGRALLPFFKGELQRAYGSRWPEVVRGVLQRRGDAVDRDGVPDLYNLLYVMTNYGVWRDAFSQGPLAESRYLVEELHQVRNRDAHIHTYGNAITYRDLDTITRVLDLIDPLEAARVRLLQQDAPGGPLPRGAPEEGRQEAFGPRVPDGVRV